MTPNLISCIMPTYNRASICIQAIEDLLFQTYKNWECIIIDDGSDEEESNILIDWINTAAKLPKVLWRPFGYYPSIITHTHFFKVKENEFYYIRLLKNSGNVSIPRSIGISHCNGEYIAHWDDDVLHYPHKLELLLEGFLQHPDATLVYGNRDTYNGTCSEDGRINVLWETGSVSRIPGWDPSVPGGWGVDGSQFIYKSKVYQHFGGKLNWVHCTNGCDYETAKAIWSIWPRSFYHIDKEVSGYVWHGENRSCRNETRNKPFFPQEFEPYFQKK